MTAIIRMLLSAAIPAGDVTEDKIIELGMRALRQQAGQELARDLLGLDGVSLPLKPRRGLD
jgi:hypothetical protein